MGRTSGKEGGIILLANYEVSTVTDSFDLDSDVLWHFQMIPLKRVADHQRWCCYCVYLVFMSHLLHRFLLM